MWTDWDILVSSYSRSSLMLSLSPAEKSLPHSNAIKRLVCAVRTLPTPPARPLPSSGRWWSRL